VRPKPDISVDANVRNPGQFFACCGLLETVARIWPDSEGWFETTTRQTTFCIASRSNQNDPLGEIVRKICEPDTFKEADAEHYDAGFRPLLLPPFNLRLDWWTEGGLNKKSPLKLWAGRQTPLGIMTDMQTELRQIKPDRDLFNQKRLMSGRFGIDVASSWTSRGLGFSPDEQNIPWGTYPATEILAAIGLQRCRPLRVEGMGGRRFVYHIWTSPLEISVLPAAAIAGKGEIADKYQFEVKMRNKQYGSFDWGRPWTTKEAEDEEAELLAG
jgi:CRISPR-associated protein Csx14